MSINLPSVAKKEFDEEVKHVYQGMQTLRGTVTARNNVVGDVYNFRRMGKGLANQKAIQSLVTPMNIGHDLQPCTLTDWLAPEYTDIFAQQEVNFDEKMELASTVGKALGRRDDQLVIDAIADMEDVSGVSWTDSLTYTYGDAEIGFSYQALGTTGFTIAVLLALREHYHNLETDDKVCIICDANAMSHMLAEEKITSSDYASVKALINGEVNTFMGFEFKIIGQRSEGGIAKVDSVDSYAYAYPKAAVGMAVGLDIRTSIDWVPERTSWLVNGILKAGAVVREPQGIARVIYQTVPA
jgi:hypothetical protein